MTQSEKIDLAIAQLDLYKEEINKALAIISKITWKSKPTADDMKELLKAEKILTGIL